MAALRNAGVSFDIVPGITAAFAAAAETEVPLTLRGQSSGLVFASGHDADSETLPELGRSGARRGNRRCLHGPFCGCQGGGAY